MVQRAGRRSYFTPQQALFTNHDSDRGIHVEFLYNSLELAPCCALQVGADALSEVEVGQEMTKQLEH